MDETWVFIDGRTNGPTDRQRDRDTDWTVGKVISTIPTFRFVPDRC